MTLVGPPAGLSTRESSIERGDPLGQAGKTTRPADCRTADAVVINSNGQPVVLTRDRDADVRGLGVFYDVRQRFGDDEVGRARSGLAVASATSTDSSTGIGQRATTEESAASSPRSVRIAG